MSVSAVVEHVFIAGNAMLIMTAMAMFSVIVSTVSVAAADFGSGEIATAHFV